MAIPEKIKKLANDIRTKIYGKDVRESLAKGIEEAGNIADETQARQNELETQFQSVLDETTDKDFNSAPEIKAARVSTDGTNHNNLKERLDKEHQEVTSQLAQTATKEELSILDANKAAKTEIFSMANMGQDIKEAMTGGSVAVVGKNSVLEENIVDGQVTPRKTNFVSLGKNLFDKRNIIPNKSITSTGIILDNSNFAVVDFIEVEPNTFYSCLNANLVTHVFYDEEENPISGSSSSVSSFTTPSNCRYIRGTLGMDFIDVFYLGRGTTAKYEPYGLTFSNSLLKKDEITRSTLNSLYENYLKDNIEWEEYAKRISFVNGKTAGARNGIAYYADSPIYSHTSQITVKPGEIWRLRGYGNPTPAKSGVLLDNANNLISMLRYNAETEQLLVIPEGATKMVVTVLTANLNSFSIAKAKTKSYEKDVNDLVNMHYADLTNELTYITGKFVRKLVGKPIEYVDNAVFSYAEIPVQGGEVWRTIDYTIPKGSTWNVRGVFLDQNGQYLSDIPYDIIDSYTNTFQVPKNATKMIINKSAATRIYKLVDWEKAFDYTVDSYTEGYFVSNSGSIVASTYYGYIEKEVNAGEIYRITDIFHGTGEHITARGVFKDSQDNVVKTIKTTLNDPYQWNDVIVPTGATKMFVNFLLSVNGIPNAVKRLTLSKAVTPTLIYGDNSDLRDKTIVQFGDSLTWYGERGTLVKHATQMKVVVQGYSGHTIAQTSKNVNLCDDAKLQLIIDQNPDIVTIMGGNNDKGYNVPLGNYSDLYADLGTENKDTYIGGYAYIIKKLLSLKPDIHFIILSPLSARGDSPNTIGLLATDYAEASRKVAEFFGFDWVDIRGKIGLNKYTLDLYTRDEVHLNFRGAQPIAQEEVKALRGINWTIA